MLYISNQFNLHVKAMLTHIAPAENLIIWCGLLQPKCFNAFSVLLVIN